MLALFIQILDLVFYKKQEVVGLVLLAVGVILELFYFFQGTNIALFIIFFLADAVIFWSLWTDGFGKNVANNNAKSVSNFDGLG